MERVKIRVTFVNNDGTLGKVLPSKNVIKIGRDISNQIRLKNLAALKLHCKIKADKSGSVSFCQNLLICVRRLFLFSSDSPFAHSANA
jgi:hypothetical protein